MRIINILFYILFINTTSSYGQLDVTGETELYNEYHRVDLKLNKTYKETLRKLKQVKRDELVYSQKTWVQRRDDLCYIDQSNAGVYENKLKICCLIDETNNRIRQLKKWKR